MPSLDSCINSIYEPGFIPGDTGLPPTEPTLTENSLNFSLSPNSMYIGSVL